MCERGLKVCVCEGRPPTVVALRNVIECGVI